MCAQASAQDVILSADGTVSVSASEVPLGAMLRAIAAVSPFQRLLIDPDVADRPITAALQHLNVTQALVTILQNAGVDYLMAGSAQLVVVNRKFAGKSRPTTRELSDGTKLMGSPALGLTVPAEQTRLSVSISEEDDATLQAQMARQAENEESIRQSEIGVQELQRILVTPPTIAPPPGSVVELPFPGPGGVPLTAIMPPKGTPIALPFPGSSAPLTPLAPRRSNPTPSTDPELQELLEILTPSPGRVR